MQKPNVMNNFFISLSFQLILTSQSSVKNWCTVCYNQATFFSRHAGDEKRISKSLISWDQSDKGKFSFIMIYWLLWLTVTCLVDLRVDCHWVCVQLHSVREKRLGVCNPPQTTPYSLITLMQLKGWIRKHRSVSCRKTTDKQHKSGPHCSLWKVQWFIFVTKRLTPPPAKNCVKASQSDENCILRQYLPISHSVCFKQSVNSLWVCCLRLRLGQGHLYLRGNISIKLY